MATFEYEALDFSGRNKRGVITADTPKKARDLLRQQRLTPVKIANARQQGASTGAKAGLKGGSKSARGTKHLKTKELVLITRQLATLVATGIPLEEALNAVASQSDSEKVRLLILQVRERILEGWRFADALAEDPNSFPALYRAVIAAGETSGDLGAVMERLATMLEKNRNMQNKAMTALIYPLALAVVAMGVVIALMRYVVPKIVTQFEDFDAELPLLTQIVISISNALRDYGALMAGLMLIIGLATWQGMKRPGIKVRVDRAVLKVPVLGKLMRALDGARFGRTLATLFAGGAPLIDALLGAQRTLANSHIREQLDTTITMVREGAGLSQGLKRANVLPPMMTHMVAAGEKSGELPALLDKTASHLEDEFETATTIALRLLEPVIIVAMGLIVMVIVLSILLPTLRLNTLASGG
ncbi:MAG: type II secretion system inner membrane protein GspF [Pseudomonadota bacterium]